MKPTINHADLIRLSKALGYPVDDDLAALLGFAVNPETEETRLIESLKGSPSPSPQQENNPQDPHQEKTQKKPEHIDFRYWYLASKEKLAESIVPVLINQTDNKTRKKRPAVPPLISLSEARSRLQRHLHICHVTKSINLPQAVKIIAQSKALEKMPFKQKQRLPDTLYLLLDLSARLEPAALERWQYLKAAQQLFGRTRLHYRPINYPPNASGELIFPDGSVFNDKLTENDTVLYIGDQGAFSLSARREQHNWQEFWEHLKQARIQTSWINLANPEQADPKRVEQLMAATMRCEGPQTDRIRHMRLALQSASATGQDQEINGEGNIKKGSVEKALAEELLVWNHPDHTHPGQIADVDIKLLHKWSRAYQRIPKPQQLSVEKSFKRWRQSIAIDTAVMENLKGGSFQHEEINSPEKIEQLFASYHNSANGLAYVNSRLMLIRHLIRESDNNPQLKKATQSLSKLVNTDSTDQQPSTNQKVLRIKQQGNKLIYGYSEKIKTPQSRLKSPVLNAHGRMIEQTGEIELRQHIQTNQFESNTQHQTFQQTTRPNWAERIWHDVSGLHAAHADGTLFQRQVATNRDQLSTWKGIHNGWNWASDYGIDEHGLWAILEVKKAKKKLTEFKLRWIPAGEFTMGSPEDEEGRSEGETQHKVRLSQGYWMAETSCTQQQWQAIMGDNSSSDKGLELPVNEISWDDCQTFITKLSQLTSGFSPQLPTEAQWENACRAGTTTAYWWGNEFDESKANSGYELTQESELPANTFGLKSMSGNVLEWCQDYRGDYPKVTTDDIMVVDPQGASRGGQRVLRGGNWFDFARILRSAARYAYSPGYRIHDIGLRLAGGYDPQASSSEDALTADRRAEQSPSDVRAASRKIPS